MSVENFEMFWHACMLSHSTVFVSLPCMECITPQASLSKRFSRQGCWSGLPFLFPGHLSNPGIKLVSPGSLELEGGFLTPTQLGRRPSPGCHHLSWTWHLPRRGPSICDWRMWSERGYSHTVEFQNSAHCITWTIRAVPKTRLVSTHREELRSLTLLCTFA